MSTQLVKVLVQIAKGAAAPTPSGQPSAGTSVVITDSNGAQPPVILTGNETPPWSFTASVAPGPSTADVSDIDSGGTVLNSLPQFPFSEVGTPVNTFLPSTSITVTPAP